MHHALKSNYRVSDCNPLTFFIVINIYVEKLGIKDLSHLILSCGTHGFVIGSYILNWADLQKKEERERDALPRKRNPAGKVFSEVWVWKTCETNGWYGRNHDSKWENWDLFGSRESWIQNSPSPTPTVFLWVYSKIWTEKLFSSSLNINYYSPSIRIFHDGPKILMVPNICKDSIITNKSKSMPCFLYGSHLTWKLKKIKNMWSMPENQTCTARAV